MRRSTTVALPAALPAALVAAVLAGLVGLPSGPPSAGSAAGPGVPGAAAVRPADDPTPAPTAPTPTATPSPTPTPTPPPPVDTGAAAVQCPIGAGRVGNAGQEARRAAQAMAGRVPIGAKGWFTFGDDPSWAPQSTLDASGNSNVHGLDWLLPLLREGVRTGRADWVDRFYALVRDWVRDNPRRPLSATGAYSQLPEGYRLVVLTCAAAGPQGDSAWLRVALRDQAEWVARADRWAAYNNTALVQTLGLVAAAEGLGRADLLDVAVRRAAQMAGVQLRADGSGREGAPGYAKADYDKFAEADKRLRLAGVHPAGALAGIAAIPGFLAWATRPDGVLEAIGDTSPAPLPDAYRDDPAATWAATAGREGRAPAQLFARFDGGYVFGRSGWGTQRPFAAETWYSLRLRTSGPTVHAHADAGSLTLAAAGSPLLLDSGQYAYTNDARRTYVRGRSAHDVVVADATAYDVQPTDVRVADSQAAGDTVTLVDDGYRGGVRLVRTVYYDRTADLFVVWDTATSPTPRTFRQTWQLGADREVSSSRWADGATAATAGPGANLSVRWAGEAPDDVAVSRGATSPLLGWNSPAYGRLVPSPAVQAVRRGTSASWLTVLVPRAAGVGDGTVAVRGAAGADRAAVAVQTAAGTRVLALTRDAAARPLSARAAVVAAPADGSLLAVRDVEVSWLHAKGVSGITGHRVVADGRVVAQVGPEDTRAVVPGLADGAHRLRVDTVAADGVQAGAEVSVTVDATAPVVGTPPTLALRAGALTAAGVPVTLRWAASDPGAAASGLASVRVLGAERGTSTRLDTTVPAGRALPVTVEAVDRAGNRTVLTATLPAPVVDPAGPAAAAGWRVVAGAGHLGGSVLAGERDGASVAAVVTGRGVGVVAARGPGAGSLRVAVDGRTVATVDLRAPAAQLRRVVWAGAFARPGRHTVTLTAVTSAARPRVLLDGLVTLG